MWLIPIFIIVFILVLIFLLLRRAGGGRFPWIQFYVKGKETGFNLHEIHLLRKVAVSTHLDKPLTLFWSLGTLDRCLKGLFIKFRSENREEGKDVIEFMAKLFSLRKKIEFDQPKYKIGLNTTRRISANQVIKITLPGQPTYTAKVVENLRRYLAISYPLGPKLPPGFTWKGQKINIYFWRKEDAGYMFQTRVLDDFYERKVPILYISHTDSLIRSQKRKSVRAFVNRRAYLFPLKSIEAATDDEETTPGLRCKLFDISEDGAAILIGGRAKVGLPIKIQFYLSDDTLTMCGVIKGINFSENKNQSILHIQSLPLRPEIRNRILVYVYNILQERDHVKGSVNPTLY